MTISNEDFAKTAQEMNAGVPTFTVDRADPRAREPIHDDLEGDEDEFEGEEDDDDGEMDFIPSEEFAQLPTAVQMELKRRARQNEKLEKKLDQLTAVVASSVNRPAEKPEPVKNSADPWADVTDQALHQYKTRVRGWQQRLVANPEDAEAAEAVKGIDWDNFAKVEQELTRRAVRSEVGGLREELAQSRRKDALDSRLNNSLLQEFDMAEIRDSNLQSSARSIVGDAFSSLGIEATNENNPDVMAVATLLGMQLAKAKSADNRRTRRGTRRPSLDLEGPSPRTSTRASKRSAAAARGDWEAVEAMDLDNFIDANGL